MFNAIKKFFTGDKPDTAATGTVPYPVPYKVETPVPVGTEASIAAPTGSENRVESPAATTPIPMVAEQAPVKKAPAKKPAPAKTTKQAPNQGTKSPGKPKAAAITKTKKPSN